MGCINDLATFPSHAADLGSIFWCLSQNCRSMSINIDAQAYCDKPAVLTLKAFVLTRRMCVVNRGIMIRASHHSRSFR
jgi:phage gp46-like protein